MKILFAGVVLFVGAVSFNMKINHSPLLNFSYEKSMLLASNNGDKDKDKKEKMGKANRTDSFNGESNRKKGKDGQARRA